jgi:hypothetical protein
VRWRDLLFPSDGRFRTLLVEQARIAARACALLAARGGPAEMARVEAAGDAARRRLAETLARTYATPWDRDDIFALSSALDDVTDAAQEAALGLAVFGGAEFAHVQEITRSLREGAAHLEEAAALVPAPAAQEPARRAKRCENVTGNLYRYGLELALRTRPPDEAARLREVLSDLRALARAIGRAAEVVADVTVKEK